MTFEVFIDQKLVLDLKADSGRNSKLRKSAPLDSEPELEWDRHYSNQLSRAAAVGLTSRRT